MKVLNPTIHGALDYALAIAFLLLPGLLGFSQTAATLSYIIGAVYLVASLITRYPLGAFKLISFPLHGVLETIMAAGWIVAPWLFGFAADVAARNFFVIAGIGLLLVVLITDYKGKGTQPAASAGERRRRMADRRQNNMPVAQNRRTALGERRRGGYATA